MFIERQQHPAIEFDEAAGQLEPTLVHFFSDRAEPFKTVLPLLVAGAAQGEQRVLVVTSPLSEVVDETIRLHRDPEWKDRVVVDEAHRAFFDAVKGSMAAAIAKLEQIEFVKLADDEDEGA